MRILITAGGTREYIDPVRFISNASSGKMGFALAHAALKAGHKVTFITTTEFRIENLEVRINNSKLKVVHVETARQMFDAVKKHFPKCDCLIMAAAVADYTPARPAKTKIKSAKKELAIKLKPTLDILKWSGKHKTDSRFTKHKPRIIVGFALEDKNLRANAEKKLKEKNFDMIVANTPAAIGADLISVQIKTPNANWLKLKNMTKAKVASRIIGLLNFD